VTIYYLPTKISICQSRKSCVYRDNRGICDDPFINNGNGDAACHRLRNKQILGFLRDLDGNEYDGHR
jgi:hypothetical protein